MNPERTHLPTRRRWLRHLALAAVASLVLSACGEPATVRYQAEVAAEDPGEESGIPAGATLEDIGPEAVRTEATLPSSTRSEQVVLASNDVLSAFVDALSRNDFEKAASFTTGPATEFVRFLMDNQACGFVLSSASHQPATEATAVREQLYVIDATATMRFGEDIVRAIDAFVVQRQGDTSYRIQDIVSLGRTTSDLVFDPTEVRADSQAGIQFTTLSMCVGPTRIEASFQVTNNEPEAFFPQTLEFRITDGLTIPITYRHRDQLEPIPAKSVGGIWNLSIPTSNGYAGGTLLVSAPDVEDSSQEDAPVFRTREYRIDPPLFFAQDPDTVDLGPLPEVLAEVIDLDD